MTTSAAEARISLPASRGDDGAPASAEQPKEVAKRKKRRKKKRRNKKKVTQLLTFTLEIMKPASHSHSQLPHPLD